MILLKHIFCLAAAIPLLMLSVPAQAVSSFRESFSATSLNTSRWTLANDQGNFTQSDGRLNYTTANSNDGAYSYVTLRGIQPTYNDNWQAFLEVTNTSSSGVSWIGLSVINAADDGDTAGLELFQDRSEITVVADYHTNGVGSPEFHRDTSAKKIYLRIDFNKSDKVITFWYRASNNNAWRKLSTFSTKANASTTRRGNWKMTNTSKFNIAIYGGGDFSTVSYGQMFADSFKIRNN